MSNDVLKTKLKDVEFLNQSLFVFKCPTNELKKIQEFSKSINWREIKSRGKSNLNSKISQGKSYIPQSKSLHYLKEFKEFFLWTNECLNNVKDTVGWNQNFIPNLSVSQSWLNCSEIGQGHHKHYHMLSILSGILYLTEPAHTQFFTKSIYALPSIIGRNKDSKKTVKHHYTGSVGELIIFPSSLEHWVGPNMDKSPRITLSINSWFKGEIGCADSLCYLNQEKNI